MTNTLLVFELRKIGCFERLVFGNFLTFYNFFMIFTLVEFSIILSTPPPLLPIISLLLALNAFGAESKNSVIFSIEISGIAILLKF